MARRFIFFGAILAVSGGALFLILDRYDDLALQRRLNQLGAIETFAVLRWQQQTGLTKDLWPGNRSVDVRLLQRALRTMDAVYPAGEVTGFFGRETTLAVARFQRERNLPITGYLDAETRARINDLYVTELCPEPEKNSPDYRFRNVNAHGLPEGYVPSDLVNVSSRVKSLGIICLREEAADALANMFDAALRDGVEIGLTSGFRRREVQELFKNSWVNLNGHQALEEVADPGHSEHQLGTAVDVTGASVGYRRTDLRFGITKEGMWLTEHAAQFGFVMSYPIERQKITGYPYEPWHWRYVGAFPAEDILEKNITLNQYLDSFE